MVYEEIVRANRSCRNSGAIGGRPIVPRLVAEMARVGQTILDFGAGRPNKEGRLPACDLLRELGCHVTAYDFGLNLNPSVHDPMALGRRYDIVYASNVLNVQSSPEMLRSTLAQIVQTVAAGGVFIGNFPASPRYLGLTGAEMTGVLEEFFSRVKIVSGGRTAPVFKCSV